MSRAGSRLGGGYSGSERRGLNANTRVNGKINTLFGPVMLGAVRRRRVFVITPPIGAFAKPLATLRHVYAPQYDMVF